MENKEKIDLTTVEFTIKNRVEKFKKIAREALRAELISPRLTKIAKYENQIEGIEDTIEKIKHRIKTHEYEITKLDTEHPNYTNRKTDLEDSIKYNKKDIEIWEKEIKNIENEIEEQKQGIARIETGKTKVSLEKLNAFTEDLIIENARKKASSIE